MDVASAVGPMTVPIKTLLLVQRPEAWINLASVWTAFRLADTFAPTVLVLPYDAEHPKTSAPKLQVVRNLLRESGVPFQEWYEGQTLGHNEFDAVIINHPYDRERPREFWFDKLAARIPVTIYIPYGPVMAGGRKNLRLQFAQPTERGATAVIARSDWERRMYASHCPSGDAHVHVLGHPRFDQLLLDLDKPPPAALATAIGGRLAVLWNSHFSFAPSYSQLSNFSTFDLIGPELFRYAIANAHWLCLVWRPHPALFPVLVRNGLLSQDEIARLRIELPQVGIILDERASHVAAFKASDAILTDVGSFFLEYLATGKPILALLNPDGEPLNEESKALVADYSTASTPRDVIAFIENLRDGVGDFPDLARARAEHLPGLDGHAGKRVASLIEHLVRGTDYMQFSLRDTPPTIQIAQQHARAVQTRAATGERFGDLHATPVLDRLIGALEQSRELKSHEARWRKAVRRTANAVRMSLGEAVKGSPRLMHLAEILRAVHTR